MAAASVLSPGGGLATEIGRALTVAWIASNVTNLWLQLRGLWQRKLPLRNAMYSAAPRINPALVLEQRGVIVQLSNALERVTAERDRLALELEHRPALAPEFETVLKFPGVSRAILAALHPDRARSAADRVANGAVSDRIGAVRADRRAVMVQGSAVIGS